MFRKIRKMAVAVALALTVSVAAAPAGADDHDPKRSGHPLRIVAYVVHPVGVLIDTLIFRPAHWIVKHEPLKTVFGHED